ncbi:uncharacterized protein LOC143291741 isoform X2 [Babylonia areolata]|uniref:uncharacterized protein LOC143291741 isoform X2 n=1 Tax=Babylonia areolata TaxID=304850 RepID=UPI003FD115C2
MKSARRMQGRGSKEELRQQVVQVTLEIQKLQDKVHDLREVFAQLENLHTEAGGCCFPFKYIMLKDMVQDVNELAGNLQHKWYGAPDQSNNAKASRGVVTRLLENCRAFTANRRALDRYEVIMEGLSGLHYKELEQTLEERQSSLAQHKVVFTQLQDLLKQLQELHRQSQETWLVPRYLMLERGVNVAIAAFTGVAGLAESYDSAQSSGTGSNKSKTHS